MFWYNSCKVELPPESKSLESSKKCLSSIANNYFTTRPTVSIYTTNYNEQDEIALEEIYKSQKHVKKYFNFTSFNVNFFAVRKYYSIVTGETLNDFISQKKQIEKLSLWNARSRYVFYTYKSNENLIEEFVNLVWYYYIINGVIMMPSEEDNEVLNVYSWYPYHEGNCGANITAQLIDKCRNGVFQNQKDLFAKKVPMNFNGCPVTVRVLIWPPFVLPPSDGVIIDDKELNINEGIEVRMIKTIGKIANFTIRFTSSTVPHDWGLATVDGNTTGAIRALKEKKADIAMGSFGPTTERRMYCDHSASHLQEMLTWCVPKAQEGPRWKNLFETFTFYSWIAMFGTYFIVSISIWMLSYCPPKDTSTFRHVNNSLIYSFSTFLGLSANETPRKISARISFFTWLIFGLHFVVAYQAKLIGVLLRPSYERQISSIEEVLKSGMEYEILPTHRRFYANTDDWKVAKIVREWKSCHDSDACLKRVAYQRDFALCTLRAHADFESLQYRDSEGQPLVYCIPYVTYPSELYMTKGYPLKDRIDKLIYKVRDSGLIFKWQRNIERVWFYKYRNTMDLTGPKEHVITMSHLQGAFVVLIFGLCVSCTIFCVEITYAYFFERKLKSVV